MDIIDIVDSISSRLVSRWPAGWSIDSKRLHRFGLFSLEQTGRQGPTGFATTILPRCLFKSWISRTILKYWSTTSIGILFGFTSTIFQAMSPMWWWILTVQTLSTAAAPSCATNRSSPFSPATGQHVFWLWYAFIETWIEHVQIKHRHWYWRIYNHISTYANLHSRVYVYVYVYVHEYICVYTKCVLYIYLFIYTYTYTYTYTYIYMYMYFMNMHVYILFKGSFV